jgi:hypothetical protein
MKASLKCANLRQRLSLKDKIKRDLRGMRANCVHTNGSESYPTACADISVVNPSSCSGREIMDKTN